MKHKDGFYSKRIRDYEILILGRAIAFAEQKNDEYNFERYRNIFRERVGKNKFLTQSERSDIYTYCGDFYLETPFKK